MMKNIYALGAYQMSRDGFVLDVVYENTEESGAITNYLSVLLRRVSMVSH